MLKSVQKIKEYRCFLCTAFGAQHGDTKSALSLYFLTDFNHSHAILTKIVSQLRIFIQNRIPTTAARSASFLKYEVINSSSLINFSWISTIRTSFWRELSHTFVPSSPVISSPFLHKTIFFSKILLEHKMNFCGKKLSKLKT